MKQLMAWMMIVGSAVLAQAGDVTVKANMTTGPGQPAVTSFPASAGTLFASFKTKGAQSGDKIRAVWIAEDVGSEAPANTKIDEKTLTLDGDTSSGIFSLSKPNNGWPAGEYRVDIYANGELATKLKFNIDAMEKAEKRDAAEKAAGGPADLNGTWVGYYEDGSKSEYVWRIKQTGSDLAISNVGGKTAKSTGWVQGEKVVAQDFPTTHGKLSPDASRITWSDGVVWKKQ